MGLQDKLDAYKKSFLETAPPEAVAIMQRATEDLKNSGIMDKVLKIGESAPEFSLPDENGNLVELKGLLAQGPAVIFFYRGIWWPYCNMELEALQETAQDIKALGTSLVVISPQLEKYSKSMAKKLNLTFPLLRDEDNQLASQFGLTFKMPDDLAALYSQFGLDLVRYNGNDLWSLPMPGRFILDQKGIVVSAEVNPDYTLRPEPSEIVKALEALVKWKTYDEVDIRQNFGHYDRFLLMDTGINPLSDEEILEFYDLIQVPIEIQEIGLDHFRAKLMELLG